MRDHDLLTRRDFVQSMGGAAAALLGCSIGGARWAKPRIFVAHGTQDEILPIDQASRGIVPELKEAGYDVHYQEFDGPHTVTRSEVTDALRWFVPA